MAFLSNKIFQTVVISILLLIIFIPPLTISVFESALFKRADEVGRTYVDEAFDRALIAFALARATNAVISVIQDSEVDISPAGVGVTIAVGEVLDPINDMIERFSLVMMASLVSLGIQKFLIDVVPWFSLKFLLAPSLLLFLFGLWKKHPWTRVMNSVAIRLLMLALLLRFSIPVIAILNEQVYQLFLNKQYVEAVDGLQQGKLTLTEFSPLLDRQEGPPETGFIASLKATALQLQAATDLRRQIERLGERLGAIVKDLLSMSVIFMLNTVLLPIFFLWGIYKLFGRMMTGSVWPQPAMAVPPPIALPAVVSVETEKKMDKE
jgi:hypothetical protein